MRLFSLSVLTVKARPTILGWLISAMLAMTLGIGSNSWAQPVSGLIVKLKPGVALEAGAFETPQAASNARAKHERERARSVASDAGVGFRQHAHVGTGHHLLSLPAPQQGAALEATLRRLRLHPEVLHVEVDERQRIQATPNDTNFALQTHLAAPSAYAAGLNMPLAWDRTTGTAVVVAVLDTGVRPNHPDLIGKLLPGYDFVSEVGYANDGNGRDSDPTDPGDWVTSAETNTALFASCDVANSSWHGTFIAGQIAAATNNGAGIAGVNWNAKILPVRVSSKCGALLSDILDAMRWAAGLSVAGVPSNPNPARIINLSFGGSQPCSAAYQDVIDEVTNAGALVVVAAGNSFGPGDTMQLKRPADCQRVLAVGAVQGNGAKTNYSYVGANMALMAPGGSQGAGLYSTLNNGLSAPSTDGYGTKIGTSFSAPMAAGVASLMLAVNPALTPYSLANRLQSSARSHVVISGLQSCTASPATACNCNIQICGAGLLDAPAALTAALKPAAVINVIGNSDLVGKTLVLDATGSSGAGTATLISYAWEFVDDARGATLQNTAAAKTVLTLSQTPGLLAVRLSVTDSGNLIGQETIAILVKLSNGTNSSSTVVSTSMFVPSPTVSSSTTTGATSGSSGSNPTGSGGGSTGAWWALGLWALVLVVLWRGRRAKRATAA